MLLGLPEALPKLVEAKFASALSSKSLIFSHTELTIIRTTTGVPFQLRYCPALARKPKPKEDHNAPTKKPDPFDNPPAELWIADVSANNPTHLLVLNKYPVIAEHFILATKLNKQQTHLLEQDDLEAAYACLKAWRDAKDNGKERRLFAFFNSGDHSGASQAHRHIQFLPVESMAKEQEQQGWKPLVDAIEASDSTGTSGFRTLPSLPFAHLGLQLPTEPTGKQLHKSYRDLLDAASHKVRDYIAKHPGTLELHSELHPAEGHSSPISYNLAMTTTALVICPRKQGGDMLRRGDGSEVGNVELNGTILAGTLMVKAEEEWELLKQEPLKLDALLEAVGIPQNASGSPVDGNKL